MQITDDYIGFLSVNMLLFIFIFFIFIALFVSFFAVVIM